MMAEVHVEAVGTGQHGSLDSNHHPARIKPTDGVAVIRTRAYGRQIDGAPGVNDK